MWCRPSISRRVPQCRALVRRLRQPAKFRAMPVLAPFAVFAVLMTGAGVIAGLMFFADPYGFALLHTWPQAVVRAAGLVTILGESGLYLIPSGVVLACLCDISFKLSQRMDAALRQIWLRLAFAFTAIAGTGMTVTVIKRLIGRMRPLHVEPQAYITFKPFSWNAAAASFPSGHATTAWAVAAVVVLLLGRRWKVPAFLLAGLVCLSRVVLGAHFVADVVVGGLFGWFATMIFARFLAGKGLVFRQTLTGALALRQPGAAKTLLAAFRQRVRARNLHE